MLEALRDAGWSNYSLFLSDDGLLIGYVETPDLDSARAAMARTTVNGRWQQEMSQFFVDLGHGHADENFALIPEVFHLEDQLARLRHRPGNTEEAFMSDITAVKDAMRRQRIETPSWGFGK